MAPESVLRAAIYSLNHSLENFTGEDDETPNFLEICKQEYRNYLDASIVELEEKTKYYDDLVNSINDTDNRRPNRIYIAGRIAIAKMDLDVYRAIREQL